MKKLRIFILTLLMVFTILPINTIAEGEDKTSDEPDVSVYATRIQLMDSTFKPNADGTANKIGKIIFGKNSSGYPQEWYILGADSGVNDDKNNTIIFATSPIETNQVFKLYDENNAYTYTYEKGTGYGDSDGTIEVYGNHYGASDLRAALRTMAADENYFTLAEQNLMNLTTVTTLDKRNSYNYTTTDKLYALTADGIHISYKTIRAGSDNSTIIGLSSYINEGNMFWLRIADNMSSTVGAANPGRFVGNKSFRYAIDVQPASNLNLTNVLFASTAIAGLTNELDVNFGMNLRLDGSDKGLGSAMVYSDHIEIKNGTNSNAALIVQGKNGTINWAYSKDIPTDGSVNKVTKTDIINALTSLNITDIDLSKCKVWLETTDTSQRMIYAVEAKQAINEVDITEIGLPNPNDAFDDSGICNTKGIDNTTPKIVWNTEDLIAKFNTTYTATITLKAKSGYEFTNATTATVKDFTVKKVEKNTDGGLTVTIEYTTKKDQINQIEQPTITVPNGTDISTIVLPDKVEVVGESGNKYQVVITPWAPDPNNNYDLNSKAEQRLKYAASIKEIPSELEYRNPDGPDTILTIIVEAAEIVPTPAPVLPTSSSSMTDDGYVVPNTGVK